MSSTKVRLLLGLCFFLLPLLEMVAAEESGILIANQLTITKSGGGLL